MMRELKILTTEFTERRRLRLRQPSAVLQELDEAGCDPRGGILGWSRVWINGGASGKAAGVVMGTTGRSRLPDRKRQQAAAVHGGGASAVAMCFGVAILLAIQGVAVAGEYEPAFLYADPKPQSHKLMARASEIDPRCKDHPEIGFSLLNEKGQPADGEWGVVDTRVAPRGKLVIWMMGGGGDLPDFTSSYGMHTIGVSYARGWFGEVQRGDQPENSWVGDIRLEATTGEDFSPLVDIPKPDGFAERSVQLVKWQAKENPQGNWGWFLTKDGTDLRWDETVILSGLSHGATSAARFAMHRKVDRVVLFTGPRDQDQDWQAGESATPPERIFGFAHMKDGGMKDHQYDRSWEMMGLNKFGPIVDVDTMSPPYGNSRQLTTDFGMSRLRVHNGVYPGNYSWKEDDKWVHAPVWEYLFTHPIEEVGKAAERRFGENWKLIKKGGEK